MKNSCIHAGFVSTSNIGKGIPVTEKPEKRNTFARGIRREAAGSQLQLTQQESLPEKFFSFPADRIIFTVPLHTDRSVFL
jgi:hypothetical protein